MWFKNESAIEMTSKHMKTSIENQIMVNAPSPVRKAYFDNLYCSIAAEAETCAVESDDRKKMAEQERRELELKGQSINLREALHRAGDNEGKTSTEEVTEVEYLDSPCSPICDTNILHDQSKWIQLIGTGLVVEAHHPCREEKGAEFACMHNHDNTDFMNQKKF